MSSNLKPVTKVIHGGTNCLEFIEQFQSDAATRMNLYSSASGPIITMTGDPYQSGFIEAVGRGVELRLVTEVTRENLAHCREIMKIADVRHIDGIVGNFIVSEGQYIASSFTGLERGALLSSIIYSNVKEIVEQQQYVFETLWSKATPASHRIKIIEENEMTEVIYGK